MVEVFFVSFLNEPSAKVVGSIKCLIEESGLIRETVEEGDLVALKFHVGELGNPYHLRPLWVKVFVDMVRDLGGLPFLTDTTTYYLGARSNAINLHSTARMHGFTSDSVGAPFIVSDGLRGEDGVVVRVDGNMIKEVEVASVIAQADVLISIAHFKGHPLVGTGGCIKNLAMGCVTKNTKLAQHRLVDIEVDTELCTGCETCQEKCRWHLPRIDNGVCVIEDPRCMRCPICRNNCPEGAITLKNLENLQLGMANAALGVLKTFKRGKTCFFNFAVNITEFCDCLSNPGKIVREDLGIYASKDIVAIDKATLDMAGKKPFQKMHGVDPEIQIKASEKLNIGTTKYELIKLP